ncbi:Ribosome-releasing factor 2, mitochondrial [Neolecta irregularis DAH-3]|uniref:Ribosome-releasing factor 2, mitochondrial n=1 Tax=Neolecta irregularis (strain DAH-3) TaxID=1198029 RepID=A0A1U7LI75_NEOID|nr:Ribosome-releasing factor 2, mitochondrial [Neolecta irregularis DAH-3]|eukprot:OLL22355.1 Ribosome-releasing factor 2, mitochondrial [Neolecta irregularis DAH-3]
MLLWLSVPLRQPHCRNSSLLKYLYSTSTNDAPIENIRNIGIIAHIDAGKTTTTERMLYYGGYTRRIGEVDQGSTVTDYLPSERSRGITIQSAAITFPWRSHRINLVDTPGHADFTFEVERSLRVLDGAVTIFDAVAGVEAQTEKVWRQSRNLARLAFVNKMDRVGAGFGRTVREIRSRLGARGVVMQLPVVNRETFVGVIEVLEEQILVWEGGDGSHVTRTNLMDHLDRDLREEARKARESLLETITELDGQLMNKFLVLDDFSKFSMSDIKSAIRRLTISNSIVPIFCGAAFKNIGVQPLLDAVIDYLPNPKECFPPIIYDADGKQIANLGESCALAFKVIHDSKRGMMVFVRVYNGTLTRGMVLQNTTSNTKEKVTKLLRMYASDAVEIPEISTGNIGVILGLKETCTGDTLVASRKPSSIRLQNIPVPPPVFISVIEPFSASNSKDLDIALVNLLKEDPSLTVSRDEETGQILLSGMGELHLEIARDRLVDEYKVKADIGRLRIGYREQVIQDSITQIKVVDREVGGKRVRAGISASVGLTTGSGIQIDGNEFDLEIPVELQSNFSYQELRNAMLTGAQAGLLRGSLISLPIYSSHIKLSNIQLFPESTLGAISSAARLAVSSVVSSTETVLMEPVMSVSVIVPESCLGGVIKDISGTRGGQIECFNDATEETKFEQFHAYTPPDHTWNGQVKEMGRPRVIKAIVPLKEMVGYSKFLGGLAAGRGSFTMVLHQWQRMSRERTKSCLKELRGY